MQNTSQLLVTHARPHIDDVAAMWLLKKFHPNFADAAVDFPARQADGSFAIPPHATPIGIGAGLFDEHKGDVNDCATTLVWKWLQEQPEVKLDELHKLAVGRMVDWILLDDLGKLNSVPWAQWSVNAVFHGFGDRVKGDDQRVYSFSVELFESLLMNFLDQAELEQDWQHRAEFTTPWGKGVALATDNSRVFGHAYSQGFVLVCRVGPEKGYRQIRADAHSAVDLSAAYQRVKELEPDNPSWYLHHSKRLLMCGSGTAREFDPSQLSLKDLIHLVQSN